MSGSCILKDVVNTEQANSCGIRLVQKVATAVKEKQCKPMASSSLEQEEEPAAVEIEYVATEDLQDVEDPAASLEGLSAQLESKDWVTICNGLTCARRLAVFHPDLLKEKLPTLVPLVLKSVKNPRSALCKTALMTTGDLFSTFKDQMLDLMGELLIQLLLKATQDKKFVCDEAERALVTMSASLSPPPLLQLLRPYVTHKNPRVRAKATVCVHNSVSQMGPQGIKEFGLPLLIQIAAAQVTDQLPEARDAARKLVLDLHAVHSQEFGGDDAAIQQEAWEKLCTSRLSPTVAQVAVKVVYPNTPPAETTNFPSKLKEAHTQPPSSQ